jgi:hypothetical protein
VPFFFKQWGGVRKSQAGRMLENQTFDAMPERPSREVPAHNVRLQMIDEVRKWAVEYDPTVTLVEPVGSAQSQQLLF